ncbi:MAG TPA: TlpA family protein disulfide reductase [Kofleriaceae bacterium]|nr:TlpA family protein disulfide reductase [Kofleriaceae bacterium]
MDRLHAVVTAALLALVAGGCKGGSGDAPDDTPSGSRVNAATSVKKQEVTPEELCDARVTGDGAPALGLPPLAAGQSPPGSGTWRWVNVWATWCKPCIEEMPLLTAWQKELAGDGLRFDLVFVSVDESDELVAEFRKKHPSTPPSLRLASPDALPPWLAAIGLGENAPIPVHVFVDPQDKVRCVRAGGVKERDLPAIRAVLGG